MTVLILFGMFLRLFVSWSRTNTDVYSPGRVVKMVDNAIHWIKLFPVGNAVGNAVGSPSTLPLDCDLASEHSGMQRLNK